MNPHAAGAPLDLGEEAQLLYRHVLRSPAGSVEDHAEAVGWSASRTSRLLADLEQLGLVRQSAGGTVRVDDPRATVGRLLDGEEAELADRRRRLVRLRETLATFEYDYRRGLQLSGPRMPPWERVPPSEATVAVDHLLRTSSGELLQASRSVADGPGYDEQVVRQRERWQASGRTSRSIFPQLALADPRWEAFAARRAADGEVQRYVPADAVPVAFGVFGTKAVLLQGGAPDEDYLLVRDPVVRGVFVALFEELWRRAEPAPGRGASGGDARLLELLALGLKDEAIARQLRLSLRTVRRRIAALMTEHGAETRYQLGLAVGRRGLPGAGRG